MFLLITAEIYLTGKIIKNNEEKINKLEKEIEGIKSTLA